jgi:hypothetical protein
MRKPAIDGNLGAGGKTRRIRAQKQDYLRYFLGAPDAAHRHQPIHIGPDRRIGGMHLRERRIDRAGRGEMTLTRICRASNSGSVPALLAGDEATIRASLATAAILGFSTLRFALAPAMPEAAEPEALAPALGHFIQAALDGPARQGRPPGTIPLLPQFPNRLASPANLLGNATP